MYVLQVLVQPTGSCIYFNQYALWMYYSLFVAPTTCIFGLVTMLFKYLLIK